MPQDPTAPVTISIVGTGKPTGGGDASVPNGTVAVTPGAQPDLRINVVSPLIAVLVRFTHLFLVTGVGLLTAAGFGVVGQEIADIPTLFATAAKTAGIVAGMGALKDLITIFGRLEGKYPLVSGSI